MMKPNKKQNEMIELVNQMSKYWQSTNDIDSPSHYTLIEEETRKLDLTEDDEERFIEALSQVYHLIKIMKS